MSDISYYTEEGYKALKDEVHHLVSVERPKISAQIGEAIDKGDLSENAEYDAAKDAQGHLEAKIAKMENLLANARIIDDSKIDNSKVFILSIVKIRNQKKRVGSNVHFSRSKRSKSRGKENIYRLSNWERSTGQVRWRCR